MPQISLYVDQATLEKIEKRAKQNKTSISKWVGNNLKKSLEDDYPEGFFDLFGSIKDDSFVEPDEIDPKYDAPREEL
jgi:hypothetical protein